MAIEFNKKGYLKRNHKLTFDEFKTQFVDDFPFYNRRIIFDEFESYVKKLFSELKEPYLKIWIDGSFVTDELEPNDIDFVVFIFHIFHEIENKLAIFDEGFHYIDNYFIPYFSDNSITTELITYWEKYFSKDRYGSNKGFIELNVLVLDEVIVDFNPNLL